MGKCPTSNVEDERPKGAVRDGRWCGGVQAGAGRLGHKVRRSETARMERRPLSGARHVPGLYQVLYNHVIWSPFKSLAAVPGVTPIL